MLTSEPLLSVVVPLHNEADNIGPLLAQLRTALAPLAYELILVDDGSTDATVATVRPLADERTSLLVLARNYGQTAAMAAGIAASRGAFVVTLDGDGQNDPADIPAMLALAQTGGWDVVAGNRARRQDGFWLRRLPSRLANALIRRLTGVHLSDYGCTLKVFRGETARQLGLYGDLHRFIPPLAALQGARMTQVAVRHHPRRHGVSKYGLGRIGPVLSDLLVVLWLQRYARRPMRLFGLAASLSVGAGLLLGLCGLLALGRGVAVSGGLLPTVAVLLLGGLNLLGLGFLAENQLRTYHESTRQPTYRIREVVRGGEPG